MRSHIQFVIFSLFNFSICYEETIAVDLSSPCADWVPYRDDKCFKIFNKVGLQTYDEAENTCHQQENISSLVSIRFLEEQKFLSNLLFNTNQLIDKVWIGAKYISNKYKWDDGSDLTFTNWAEGSPRNRTDYCVQMHSDTASVGKWVDEPCKNKNLIVCQKRQTWSLSRLQEILLDVKQNPVPIGFIYVQLPNEKSATEIWPWMSWNDVSSAYAGVFFRVMGEEAGSFGQIQADNAPRLINVHTGYYDTNCNRTSVNDTTPIPKGGISDLTPGCPVHRMDFEMSGGEVRPRNMAIRIWKRAG